MRSHDTLLQVYTAVFDSKLTTNAKCYMKFPLDDNVQM